MCNSRRHGQPDVEVHFFFFWGDKIKKTQLYSFSLLQLHCDLAEVFLFFLSSIKKRMNQRSSLFFFFF
jgi:hypothetical protein